MPLRPSLWTAAFRLTLLALALLALALQALALQAVGGTRAAPAGTASAAPAAGQAVPGRGAAHPFAIPWAGWKAALYRVYDQIFEDRVLAVAGGVVFFTLLAVFPAVTALVSSYGLFADPASIVAHLHFISTLMPVAAYGLIEEQIGRIVAQGTGELGLTFVIGLAVALWSANAGMKAIIDALNVIYGRPETRGFIWLTAFSLVLTISALAAFLVAIAGIVVLPLVLAWSGFGNATGWLVALARWPALLLLIMGGLMVLYRLGPDRRHSAWRWLIVGAAVATLAWLAASALLSWYLANFADYNATYGSLGAGIGLMMWLWLSVIAVLVGAELNSELERQTLGVRRDV